MVMTSLAATLYCLPPVLMTANITRSFYRTAFEAVPRAVFLGFCFAAPADHSATGIVARSLKTKRRGSSPRFAEAVLKPDRPGKVKRIGGLARAFRARSPHDLPGAEDVGPQNFPLAKPCHPLRSRSGFCISRP